MLSHGHFINNSNHYPKHDDIARRSEVHYPSRIDIGKGAFGTVFEAQINNRKVAIKALSKTIIKRHNLSQRVRNEVSIHFQLRHPNILELLHFFEDGENVYLVMELAVCELYQKIKKEGNLMEGEVRRIFGAVVDGVAYLHSHGIIHRDLKLSNILLTSASIPKIADFGLAVKMIDAENDREQQTLCGTPNYLAPEVILKNPYGRSADLWSLGCLLYTLIVGRPPFESNNIRETFSKVSKGDFEIPHTVSPSARDLISKLIVLDPNQRIRIEDIKRHSFLKTTPPVPPFHSSSPQIHDKKSTTPLCTVHLKPIKQTTKHGILQILEDRQLLIDFYKEPNLYLISSDGFQVELHDRPFTRSRPRLTHSFHDLSPSLSQIYEYGRRFVNLLRSKTPQVIIITNEYRAYLMDNEKEPFDFQVRYDSGKRIEFTPSSGSNEKVVIKSYNGEILQVTNINDSNPIIVNLLRRYKQSLDVRPRSREGTFPVIIREEDNSPFTVIGDITVPQMTALFASSIPSPIHHDPEKSFQYACKTFIPEIGWCLASAHQQFLLLFTDGKTILIDGKGNRVAYAEGNGRVQSRWYHIDEHLPSSLKEKLLYFPKFIHSLRSGGGHSFFVDS